MSMVDEIGAFLQVTGHGTLATDLYKRHLPNDPDEAVCVIQLEGEVPEFVQESFNIEVEHPQLQVISRSMNPHTAEQMLDGPYRELMGIRNQIIGGTKYVSITPMFAPAVYDRDDNGRFIARCDFQVRKELSSAT